MALNLEPQIRVIFAGTKKTFLQLKDNGLKSYLNGISIIDARIGIEFWRRWNDNNYKGLIKIIEELETPFFDGPVSKFGWHRCNKAILQAAGLMDRIDRMPMPSLDKNEYQEVLETYKKIKSKINTTLYEKIL